MELYDITKDLFTYLSNLRWRVASGEKPPLEEIQKDLFNVFRGQESRIRKHPAVRPAFEQVKYPLVVFADEMILSSDLVNAPDWDAMLLEQRFYETNIGGDRFFELLEETEEQDPQVALILYLCLEMGFRGRYASDEDTINFLKGELFKAFEDAIDKKDERLCPEAYPTHSIKQPRMLPPILKWHHLIYLAAAIVVIYILIDRVVIWRVITTPLRQVHYLALENLSYAPGVAGQRRYSVTDSRKVSDVETPSAGSAGKRPGGGAQGRSGQPRPVSESTLSSSKSGTAVPEHVVYSGYTLQLGAFKSKSQAMKIVVRLNQDGHRAFWIAGHEPSGEVLYYVRTGYFKASEQDKAEKAAAELRRNEQIDTTVVPTKAYVQMRQSYGEPAVESPAEPVVSNEPGAVIESDLPIAAHRPAKTALAKDSRAAAATDKIKAADDIKGVGQSDPPKFAPPKKLRKQPAPKKIKGAAAGSPARGYTIQVGNYYSRKDADALLERLKKQGIKDAEIVRGDGEGKARYRVLMGRYDAGSLDAARARAAKLGQKKGVKTFVTAYDPPKPDVKGQLRESESDPFSGYTIQLGAFSDQRNAEQYADILKHEGVDVYWAKGLMKNGKQGYFLRTGRFDSSQLTIAKELAAKLRKEKNLDAFVLKVE